MFDAGIVLNISLIYRRGAMGTATTPATTGATMFDAGIVLNISLIYRRGCNGYSNDPCNDGCNDV